MPDSQLKYDPYAAAKKAATIEPDPSVAAIRNHPFWNWLTNKTGVDPHFVSNALDIISMADAAGMPFKGTVFHGTPANFEHFDPSLYNKADILGSFTHFAKDPERADYWVNSYKNEVPSAIGDPHNFKYKTVDNTYNKFPKFELAEGPKQVLGKEGHNIIPAKLDLKNALDLTASELPAEDVSAIMHNLEPHEQEHFQQALTTDAGRKANGLDPMNHASDWVLQHLRVNPGLLEKAGFDGVRYYDVGGGLESYAVPQVKDLKTPWGTNLGDKETEYFWNRNDQAKPQQSLSPKNWSEHLGVPLANKISDFYNQVKSYLPSSQPMTDAEGEYYTSPTDTSAAKSWNEMGKNPKSKLKILNKHSGEVLTGDQFANLYFSDPITDQHITDSIRTDPAFKQVYEITK